jgi:hypothetical protein
MLKFKFLSLFPTAVVLNLLAIATPVRANCADQVASRTVVQPAMERNFKQLQQQETYPWGKVRPYDKLSGAEITLTPDFDRLTGQQKQQVLDKATSYTLTPEERKAAGDYIGTLAPYVIYDSDGRIVSYPYDGCTLLTLLTEKERYSFYFTRNIYNVDKSKIEQESRNVGNPPGRKVRYPITAAQERKTRLLFWKTIGYDQVNNGWWIAWVPEKDYFEINLTKDYNKQLLERFIQVAPIQYRYMLVTTDGTFLVRIKKF